MPDENSYKNLINDIIAKQTIVLGPDIVILKARNVPGLTVGDDGKVLSLHGDPQQVLQKLVDEYIALSGQIVKNILNPVLEKYPDIKISI
ncbi:MAG: hypothetical protein HY336_00535 [Candidatus Doudnabacteria bacterium]|nr:hypothetical protein [Candidatus Doudnabacteria bacterium]